MNQPLVSVVIATYNASHLLRYAIKSVRLSDYPHFEIIVVGDHCTDDTEMVVASFADERIRFINLERNSGQQATPNNAGVAAARGEYLCFLNHDDMYLPHHLSSSLAMMRRMQADIVCSAYPVIISGQFESFSSRTIAAFGQGFEPTGSYSPHTFRVASAWFMRREAARVAGPWKLEDQTWVTPSQDWLFRAWRKGLRIHCTRQMSVIVLHAGDRRNSYRKRDSSEHETVFQAVVATDRLRSDVLEAADRCFDAVFLHELRRKLRRKPRKLRKRLRALRWRVCDQLLTWLGIHPNSRFVIKHWGWRRGEIIRNHQRITGSKQVIE